jgi:hypothetical protein
MRHPPARIFSNRGTLSGLLFDTTPSIHGNRSLNISHSTCLASVCAPRLAGAHNRVTRHVYVLCSPECSRSICTRHAESQHRPSKGVSPSESGYLCSLC